MRENFCIVSFVLLCTTSFSQTLETETIMSSISPQRVHGTMSFLASDLLEGRLPGTRGFALASQYVQSQFTAVGLQPAGDSGFVQSVSFKKGIVNGTASELRVSGGKTPMTMTYDADYYYSPYYAGQTSEVTAPLVFAGWGISAPELKYDDYKGIDAKGKIVVLMDQAPDGFANTERAYYSSPNTKFQEASRRGAVGVIMLLVSTRTSWDRLISRNKQGGYRWLDKDNVAVNAFPELKAVAMIHPKQHHRFFERSGKKLEDIFSRLKEGKPQSFELKLNATMKVSTKHSAVSSSNLIGTIPGSDPTLKKEHIVYVAHLDHFGIGASIKGDSIYNGAHDNASGVAIILEVARAFQSLKTKPKRSITFAVVTAEEFGLLGSDYFVNNPTLDGPIVANLTLDMPFFFHPVLDVVPYGAQHSSLSRQVDEATKKLNLKISPDPFPEQVVFIRSDHYSFVRKGIPALFIKSGFTTDASDTIDRSKTDVAWRSTTYHTPQDDMSQQFNFEGGATHAKLNFLIGYLVANATERPRWNDNDFFGLKFGR
jgi:Zn-dependent M28 family amino/carboxypeptidase